MANTSPNINANTAKPIKFFRIIREYYQTIGLYSSETNSNQFLNAKVLILTCSYIPFLFGLIGFLFKAKTIGDLAFSYCGSLTIVLVIFSTMVNALKIPNIFILIDQYDEFIRKSELEYRMNHLNFISILFIDHTIFSFFSFLEILISNSDAVGHKYRKLNEKIEQISELTHFGMIKLGAPLAMFPALPITVLNYFVYDLGDDSYFLPAPVV